MAIKKVMKKPAGEKKMARKGKKTFNSYIFKVLKQVHPKTGMSKKSMNIVNSIVADTFDKIILEDLQHNTGLMAAAVWLLAESEDTLLPKTKTKRRR